MKTFKRTFTEDHLTSAFGVDALIKIAKLNGYPDEIGNPNYVKGNGQPAAIPDPDFETDPNDPQEPPLVPNPDFIADQGTPTIPNPETHAEFLNRLVWEKGLAALYMPYRNFIKEEYGNQGVVQADTQFSQVKDAATLEVIE